MLETNLSISKDEMMRALDEFGGYVVDESDSSGFVVVNSKSGELVEGIQITEGKESLVFKF